jgi:NTP pyrophosphatase (non-canonical NTP hydrolase)
MKTTIISYLERNPTATIAMMSQELQESVEAIEDHILDAVTEIGKKCFRIFYIVYSIDEEGTQKLSLVNEKKAESIQYG